MDEVSERDRRQFDLMRRRVADLRSGRRDIGAVINDLSALLWELQETPEDWRQRYLEAWGNLEIPYALALDAGGPLPTSEDDAIALALDDLDALLDEREGG